jgi:putative two-component system response regulator
MATEDVLALSQILVVDDEAANVRLFERLLASAGCTHVLGITDPREVIGAFARTRPDLVVLDLHMPHLDGFEVMQALRPLLATERYLPVLVITADASASVRQRALAMGVRDFLCKPFDRVEALLRMRNLLVTRQLYAQLEREQQRLELAVADRTRALDGAHLEIVERLARAAEYRDDNTGEHTRRVGRLAGRLARSLGLPPLASETIERAAPLHDVGKVGVPDAILLKPGPLTPGEFTVLKTHAQMGARILSGSRVPLLRAAEEIAMSHHERWDGSGYPLGLTGEGIPLAGRIVALADAFDAMTHVRPYQAAMTTVDAREAISSERGRHFDPQVVDAFNGSFDDYVLSLEEPDARPHAQRQSAEEKREVAGQ